MLEQKYSWVGLCSAWAAQNPDQRDIQWFKDEMRISPKYIEEQEGILGMTWPHFLVMVLLIIFFIGALIAMYLRQKRTKQILASLLQEERNESKS
jgi:cbb3-type cytochrome oxidase subunit 3